MLERDQRVEIRKNWELFQVAAYQNWQDSVQQIERDGIGNLVVNEPKVVAYRHDNGEVSIIRLLPESSSVSGSTVRTSPVSTNIELAYFHPGIDGYYDVTRLFPAEMQSFFSAPRGLPEINKYLNDLMASFNRTPTDATTEPDTNISKPVDSKSDVTELAHEGDDQAIVPAEGKPEPEIDTKAMLREVNTQLDRLYMMIFNYELGSDFSPESFLKRVNALYNHMQPLTRQLRDGGRYDEIEKLRPIYNPLSDVKMMAEALATFDKGPDAVYQASKSNIESVALDGMREAEAKGAPEALKAVYRLAILRMKDKLEMAVAACKSVLEQPE